MQARLSSTVLSLAVVACLTAACGGETSVTTVTGPEPVRCTISFEGGVPTVPARGASMTVTVVSDRECSWTTSTQDNWIQVTPSSGQGEAPITVRVAENDRPNTRAGGVAVNSQRLTVSQDAAPCRFNLSSSISRVSDAAGNTTVSVSALAGCSWTTSNSASWVRVVTAGGNGDGAVGMNYERNVGPERTAVITIAGQSFSLVQAAPGAAPGPAPQPPAPGPTPAPPKPPPNPSPNPPPNPGPNPPPSPSCEYEIDPSSRSFSEKAHHDDFKVHTSDLCVWTASSNASWISITSGAAGVGDGQVKYQVAQNNSGRDRVGTISAGGQTHTVTQKGS